MTSGPFSPEEDERIIAGALEGKTTYQVAKELGRHASNVARRREKLRAAGRLEKMQRGPKPGLSEEERMGIRMLLSQWLVLSDGTRMRTVRAV